MAFGITDTNEEWEVQSKTEGLQGSTAEIQLYCLKIRPQINLEISLEIVLYTIQLVHKKQGNLCTAPVLDTSFRSPSSFSIVMSLSECPGYHSLLTFLFSGV